MREKTHDGFELSEPSMDKDQLKKLRAAAVNIELDLDDGDAIREMISRGHGLFLITTTKIMRIRSPDEIDPALEHHDVPWEQSVFLPHGSSDPLVARTILQTARLAEIFFGKESEQYVRLSDISWEVMSSLILIRTIRERLDRRISEIVSIIEGDIEKYTKGNSPTPLPIVEYYDIEFRSFINEVRRALNKISELFSVLTPMNFDRGHFHTAQAWATKERGADSLLAQMLANDQRWIRTWIDMRSALEHPTKEKFVETLNFSLEADRNIRLPTWRFVHPEYDMARPQNLLDVFEICINNVLKFFEDLQIALVDGHLPDLHKVEFGEIPEENRDKNAPMRYEIRHFFENGNPPV